MEQGAVRMQGPSEWVTAAYRSATARPAGPVGAAA
jgi:hypothetical protein